MKWTTEEIEACIALFNEGGSFLDAAKLIGRSHASVNSKFNRMGVKSGFTPINSNPSKDCTQINWVEIQQEYDAGATFDEIAKKYKLHNNHIKWAKTNNLFTTRPRSESIRLSWQKRLRDFDKEPLSLYRFRCRFTFGVKLYPEWFDLGLIEKYGWYSPKNKHNNIGGVSRDHMVSVAWGYKNSVDPSMLSHPANCELMIHSNNSKKKNKCSITLEELSYRISEFEKLYGPYL